MPIQTTFMNSIIGLDSVPVPPQALSYIMATGSNPQAFNDELNILPGNAIVSGGSEKMNSRLAAPQVLPRSLIGTFAVSAGISVAWIMASVDDPLSSAGWTIRGDRLGNEDSNYPPQIGGAY